MKLPPANGCAVCGNVTSKRCSRCKMVKYCSEACQRSDWNLGHKYGCRDFQSSVKGNSEQSASTLQRRKSFGNSLVPSSGKNNILNQSKKILFPYEEFLDFFYWDSPGYPPCGLINCGNSCFANVVLQCLTHTKPLVAYLLEKGHQKECRSNGWCILCEFQLHVERASWSRQPFSPIDILSRLPNIGGNLSCGKQEDAHEFMRFAIDTMQSVFLDEFNGDKAVPLSIRETTIIQHIFGGHLQSRVICTKCGNISNQFENMMDLTVEIHGDAESLEECLDQFTAQECMDGENMYKCDRCNDYVKAWKRLTIREAPNILTIALKRFQKGGFGKLNQRVIFPESLDLNPNMSEAGDDNDSFKLYAVIVHVDMLNASNCGHYICYIKDFSGNWYRVDDTQVVDVDIDEILSQEAYMLLYSRIIARPTYLYPLESLNNEDHAIVKVERKQYSPLQPLECHKTTVSPAICADPGSSPIDNRSEIVRAKEEFPSVTNFEGGKEDRYMVDSRASRKVLQELQDVGESSADEATYRLRMLSSPWPFIDSSDEAVIQKPEGRFLVSEIEEKAETWKGTLYKSLFGSSSEDSVATDFRFLVSDIEEEAETCKGTVYESLFGSHREDSVATNGEMQYDASASASDSSSSEILFDMEFDNSTLLPEKAKYEKEFSSHGIHDVILKTDGGISSGEKLKPLFTPGFLGKRPRDKCAKQEVKGEVCQNSTLCDPTNACTHSGLSCEKPMLKPLFTPGFLGKRPCDKCAKQEVRGEVCQNNNLCDPTNACTHSGLSCEKPMLKPLFTPGFLGKRPRDKCAKQEVKGEVCQNSTLCDPTNACTHSGLSCEKPMLKPLFTPGFLGKRPCDKCAKQEVRGEVCQNNNLCDPTNACTHSGLSCEKPMLKPLFTPGFLGKRPCDKCAKQEVRGEVCQNNNLCDPTNACTQSGLSCEKPMLKPLFTPGFLGKWPRDKCAKQEVRGEVCQNNNLCDPTNACTHSGLSCEKPMLKPLFTPGFLGKRPCDKCAKQEVRGEVCQNNNLCDTTNACTHSGLSCEKPMLKPLFTPGFLGKRPCDKCAKQEVGGEVCQNNNLCDPTNACTHSGLSCEKPMLKPLFTPGFLGKRPCDKCAKQEVRGEVCQNNNLCDPTNACTQSGLSCEKPMLKPLFTPGFLGKCPRDKCAKQEVRGEVCQNNILCDPTNAWAQSGLSCEKPEK